MQQYRLKYLQAIKVARRHRMIVYIDESYVNQHHHAAKTWLRSDSKVCLDSQTMIMYVHEGVYGCNITHVLN